MSASDKKPWSQRLMPGASTVSLPSRTAAEAHEYAWGKPSASRKATKAASKPATSKETDEAALAEHQGEHLSPPLDALGLQESSVVWGMRGHRLTHARWPSLPCR